MAREPTRPRNRVRNRQFAEVLAKAAKVLGSQQEAEQWLERPALGLDQRRPIDLLKTQAGVKLVEQHLERMQGVPGTPY